MFRIRRREGRTARGFVRVYAWMMLVSTALAVAAAALVVTSGGTRYEATTEVLVRPTITQSGTFIAPTMPTEQRLALSGVIAGRAAARLGVSREEVIDNVSVDVPVDTNVLQITYEAPTRLAAFLGTTYFAGEFVSFRNGGQQRRPVATVVTRATVPDEPMTPDYALIFGVCAIAGLTVGFGAAYGWDRLRGRLRTIEDAGRSAAVPVLASWPMLRRKERGSLEPDPAAARLVAHVPDLLDTHDSFTLLLSGVGPRCGTSTAAFQTALSLARMGKRVSLVADALPPDVARGSGPAGGVSEDDEILGLLTGRTIVPGAVPGLRLALRSGEDREGETSTLDELGLLVHTLGQDGIVVLDGPPAMDAVVPLHVADRAVLVVDVRRGNRAAVRTAAEALSAERGKLVGAVTTMARRGGRVGPGLRMRFARARSFRWRRSSSVGLEPSPEPSPAAGTQDQVAALARSARSSQRGSVRLQLTVFTVGVALFIGLTMIFADRAVHRGLGASGTVADQGAPPRAGYFETLPPGTWKDLPGDQQCAVRVHQTGWEPRPSNREANMTMPDPKAVHAALTMRPRGGLHDTYDPRWNRWLLPRVSGQHTGTTDENIQWAACKWGISDNLLRAIAAAESTWFQYLVKPDSEGCVETRGCGDLVDRPTPASRVFCRWVNSHGHDYSKDYRPGVCPRTFSLVGVMSWQDPTWGAMPDNQNGTFPFNRESTAFALDYLGSYLRGCYEGWIRWMVNTGDGTYKAGDLWGCVGTWFAGSWHVPEAKQYVSSVRGLLVERRWLDPDWRERYQLPIATVGNE